MGSSGVLIRLAAKTAPLEQWEVGRELRQRVKAALDAEGILVGVPLSEIRTTPPARSTPAKRTRR
jgi:small-conductance mechanosensitive channel